MNLFPKFLERNNIFEKLRQGSDESIINVCNSIMSFLSNGSLRGSQPTMSVDEILMIFLEYMTISTSYYGIKSVLLCVESIAKINKKYEDCVLQTGLVGAIVDLLRNIQNNKFKNKTNNNHNNNNNNNNISIEIGLIIGRILCFFTCNDKRSCLIFRLHHGIHCLISFVESNKKILNNTNRYKQIIEYTLNICYECVSHSEHAAMQMYESNGLEMCLQFISNYKPSAISPINNNNKNKSNKSIIQYCIDLICSICKLNPKIHQTFIEIKGFKIIVDYLCKLQNINTEKTKCNTIKLLQLISTICIDSFCAKKMLSNGTLSTLYPFLLTKSQNEEIKCTAWHLLSNILRYGMKDIIQSQSFELYKFNETHTKVHIKKNMANLNDEMNEIDFPELEPLRKRKAFRQEILKESDYFTKSIIPFVTQPPLHPWSRLLPSDLQKLKENMEKKNKKRKKRNSLPSPTFNKSTKSHRRRKSGSFILQNKALSNTRSSSSLLIKNSKSNENNNSNNSTVEHDEIEENISCQSVPPLILHNNNNTNNHRISSQSFCIANNSNNNKYKNNLLSSLSLEESRKYVSSSWIKNYYTNTTSSYLETRPLRGEPLCFQPCNLIIKLLYQQILTKSSANLTFTPRIIYDRNNNNNIQCEQHLSNENTNNNNNNNNNDIHTNSKQSKFKRLKNDIPRLEFESRFECGNLHRVIQTGPVEYDLLVSSDYNSNRHRQWFYFQIKNMVNGVQYKFNIINYDKPDSVYNRGCKPTIYSTKRFKETGIGWTRAHTNDTYYYSNSYKNDYQPKFTEIEASSISLSPKILSKKPAFSNFNHIHDDEEDKNNNNDSAESSDIDEGDGNNQNIKIISTPNKKTRKKAASLNNSDGTHHIKKSKRKRIHNECQSERLSQSISPQPPKIKISRKCKSNSASTSIATSAQSSRETSPQPITRLNYKQIRKRRARLRNKKLYQSKNKEITDNNTNDTNYTNVLHRDNAISFDILLSSSTSTKRLIGGRKKRKIPSNISNNNNINNNNNITHTIPSIGSYINNNNNNNNNYFDREYNKTEHDKKYHYTLTFTIRFPYSNDICFLSYFYPFSYSDLMGWLNVLSLSPITNNNNNIFRRQLLCRSRLGNRIDLLTITNFNSTMNIIRDRPIIILSSRVHPGEVNASWIMKGIIDFLLSKNSISSELRNKFIFKIIPCLNPDGVISGNHRCSLHGVDLNRQYLNPSNIYHPSIYHLKKLVSTIYSDISRKIYLICDIHGHSRMMNVTLYGCSPDSDHRNNRSSNRGNIHNKLHNNNKLKSFASTKLASIDYLLPNYCLDTTDRYKLFAYLLSERAPNLFNYNQCIWNISKQKEGTARVVFWRQFNIQNAFTLESSFCGSNLNTNLKGFHFNTSHYLQVGTKFVASLYDICSDSNQSKLKIQTAIKHLKSMQQNNNQNNNDNHNNNNNKKIRIRKRKKV